MKAYSYILVLLFAGLYFSCADFPSYEFPIDAKPIDIYLENHSVNNRPHLKIAHDAFSKDFLLYGTFIPMLQSSTGHSLKGRVVRFEIFADRVIMLESPKGHSISGDSDSIILLAEFPIVQTVPSGVVIDFARGMTSAFTMRNVHSRAVSDRDASTAEQFRSIFLSASFIKSVEAKGDVLSISQIAQWRNHKSELISAEFRYFFREYLPSKTFEKMHFGRHRFVQYFSTPPMVYPPTTEPVSYVAKWDISQPIIFYLSANTPEKYRKAITDGLTFWNPLFEKDVVEVRDLDPGIAAPHPRLNILQWITWDNQASAYADMVVDHLTGEVLQAQIYVRSGWVIQSIKKLKDQLEELLLSDTKKASLPPLDESVPLPSMFDLEDPCLMTMTNFSEVVDLAASLSKGPISDELLTVLTGDILRAVIAHEMGHVLGIRHNLSGSTEGTITLAERDALLKSYLQTGHYNLSDDKFLSRSIMDVFSAADDAIVGAQIRQLMENQKTASTLKEIYTFDKQAIDYAYFKKPMRGDVAFCTDDDIPKFLDCRRWDLTNTPIVYAANRLNTMLNQVAIVLADTFLAAIAPDRKGGPLALKDIPLTNSGVLKILELHAKELFLWFNKATRSAKIESDLEAFGPQSEGEITKQRFKSMRDELEKSPVGSTLFGHLPPFRSEQKEPQYLAKIFREHFEVGVKKLSQKFPDFQMNEAEITDAQNIAERFFAKLNLDIIGLIANIVSRAQFDDPDFQTPIEDALGEIAKTIVLSTTNEQSTANALPKFMYDLKTRDAAAQLLNPSLGILPDWSFNNLQNLANSLKQLMRKYGAVGKTQTVDLATMTREQRQWMLDQNRILNTLMRIRTMSRPFSTPKVEAPATPPEDETTP